VWNRAKPTFDQIFARKSEASTAPEVRLVTIWFGMSSFSSRHPCILSLSPRLFSRFLLDRLSRHVSPLSSPQTPRFPTFSLTKPLHPGTNDATLPPLPQSTPLPTFLANLNHFLTSLTSPSSPYAVTDTPVSIILITPPPIVRGMMEVGKRGDRTPERTREFRDAVLKLGSDWGESGKGRGIGWKVATVDLWGAIMRAAGANDEGEDRGEEEEEGLRPFFMYVYVHFPLIPIDPFSHPGFCSRLTLKLESEMM